MQFAIQIPNFGTGGDPRTLVDLARRAEDAGWDGFFVWDHLLVDPTWTLEVADPWIALAAIAQATSRIRLGPMVAALPRRRPAKLARETASLDRLSDGRLILGLGPGEDAPDFEPFGDPHDRATRIGRMDDGLAIIDAGLRGQRIDHAGAFLSARGVVIGPPPVQQPRPPVWLGAFRPGGIRRAARWDGWIGVGMSVNGDAMTMTPEAFRELVTIAHEERRALGRAGEPFDVAMLGLSEPGEAEPSASFGRAGATWWLESLSPMRGSLEVLEAIVRRGPPR
jgi:alkanesulfonate monooxygenase SsuD/methylene tetrahydromethanopterin reductase-like flavin-dependent oxidoreductase (luciferase family)